jgi:hypothetical protein
VSFNVFCNVRGAPSYFGFRIPERTGCMWFAQIRHPNMPGTPLGTHVCEGCVKGVLNPMAVEPVGIPAGLMRTASKIKQQELQSNQHAETEVHAEMREAFDRFSPKYLLEGLRTNVANIIFFKMLCDVMPTWDTVEGIVDDLIEAAGLLSTSGEGVKLTDCGGGNCKVADKPFLILYAPKPDNALSRRFDVPSLIDIRELPVGVVLTGVIEGTETVGAYRISDVLRSDRPATADAEIIDAPKKTDSPATMIRPDSIVFRSLAELKRNKSQTDILSARQRLAILFPEVFV